MAAYREMYVKLFQATERAVRLLQDPCFHRRQTAIRLLQQAQSDCEEIYIRWEDPVLTLLPPERTPEAQ